MVTKDVNLGTILPVLLFLLAQTLGGVWWASQIHASVNEIESSFETFQTDAAAENLRQWARINQNENMAEQSRSDFRVLSAELRAVRDRLTQIDEGIKLNNSLLREYIASSLADRINSQKDQ